MQGEEDRFPKSQILIQSDGLTFRPNRIKICFPYMEGNEAETEVFTPIAQASVALFREEEVF